MDKHGAAGVLGEFGVLLERGRARALSVLLVDPDKQRELEETFGVEYCKGRYPELYGINRPPVYDEPDQALQRTLLG